MRISVQSHEYSGNPKDPRNELDWHLVQSAYVVQDQFLKLVINFDGELSCSCSDQNSIGFMFEQDQEWQGWFETEVHFIGETPAEVELLKATSSVRKKRVRWLSPSFHGSTPMRLPNSHRGVKISSPASVAPRKNKHSVFKTPAKFSHCVKKRSVFFGAGLKKGLGFFVGSVKKEPRFFAISAYFSG